MTKRPVSLISKILPVIFAIVIAVFAVPQIQAQTLIPGSSDAETAPSGASQTLIDILEDDAARAELIARLQAAVPAVPDVTAPVDLTVAQQIVAEVTGAIASVSQVAQRTVTEIGRALRLLQTVPVTGFTMSPELVTLLMLIGVVAGVGLIGKLALDRVIARNKVTALTPIRRRIGLIVLYALLRVLILTAVWASGYGMAVWRQTTGSGPAPTEAIFLTTVLVFGLLRIALRLIVTPDAEREPTLSHLHPRAQEAIYRSLRSFIGALTFSFMFVLPLVQEWIGFVTVRPVRTLLATILLVMAFVTLKRIVAVLDISRATPGPDEAGAGVMLSRGVQNAWHSVWPPLAGVYVLYCWLVAITRPRELGDIVLGGTIWSVMAVTVALFGLWMLRLSTTLNMPMPKAIDRAMPDLAHRISHVSRGLAGLVSMTLIVTAAIMALAAWGLVDGDGWLSDADTQMVFWRIVSAVLLAAVLSVLWAVIASFVDQRLRGAALLDNSRARTLLGLFRNAFTIFVAILGTMVVLSQLGIDIAPLLAGAGVIGLAIGFGAQKLVQDIITGVFIQLENAINEGDVVGVAGITGAVEKLSIRSVRLRTLDGAQHIVPFSSVDTVTNLTRDYSYHLAEIGVAYKEKVPDVIAAMQAAFDTLREGPFGADITDEFDMHGVIALGDSSVVVRARIKTRPGKQWGLGREYTALVKAEFDSRGIEIPFPHRQLVLPQEFLDALAKRPGDDAKVIEG